uniref:Uncharacterized protein n=1 Tax=Arundo donax TaxID=35708 RepID=A0A0A9F8X2_ARUDO
MLKLPYLQKVYY